MRKDSGKIGNYRHIRLFYSNIISVIIEFFLMEN